jgi:hypothetical protein
MPSVRGVTLATEKSDFFSGSAKRARSFGGWISSRRASGGFHSRILGLKF